MVVKLVAALCLLHLFSSAQLKCQAVDLNMMPDTFDDQYLCCVEEMEREVPKILEQEKKYNQFTTMWNKANEHWKQKKPNLGLPAEFKDEYGIAVVLYTMQAPYPIYKQLNRNVSIAGRTRDYYMDNFHFKALHYYLTRALQVLEEGCAERFEVYRGTTLGNINVSPEFRFGQFASSSVKSAIAAGFGENPFFHISTCFGVDIKELSDYEEEEILIPVAETFDNIKKTGNTYEVKSTGQLCSYYNCAYLGGKKRSEPVCNSGGNKTKAVCNTAPGMFLYPESRTPLILSGLTVILNVIFTTLF